MIADNLHNGSFRQRTIPAGKGVMICEGEVHKVVFSKDAVVKVISFSPPDAQFPLQGEKIKVDDFTLTGIYSDKDVKVVKCHGGEIFKKHYHDGKEWLEVIKGSVTIYCYKLLVVGLLWFIINGIDVRLP